MTLPVPAPKQETKQIDTYCCNENQSEVNLNGNDQDYKMKKGRSQ